MVTESFIQALAAILLEEISPLAGTLFIFAMTREYTPTFTKLLAGKLDNYLRVHVLCEYWRQYNIILPDIDGRLRLQQHAVEIRTCSAQACIIFFLSNVV